MVDKVIPEAGPVVPAAPIDQMQPLFVRTTAILDHVRVPDVEDALLLQPLADRRPQGNGNRWVLNCLRWACGGAHIEHYPTQAKVALEVRLCRHRGLLV